jgi:hypothetical protein
VTEVQTVTGTVSAPAETELVTVRRNGRTLVIRRPSETVTDTDTVRGRVRERVVTDTRTVIRPTTVTQTGPGRTDTVTETRDVSGPTHTVTETETTEKTVTEEVTETETVTVTVPPGKQ